MMFIKKRLATLVGQVYIKKCSITRLFYSQAFHEMSKSVLEIDFPYESKKIKFIFLENFAPSSQENLFLLSYI